MKNYLIIKSLIILSLMFSSDLLAGKRKNHRANNKGTVTRKPPPPPPHEEKTLVPVPPPLPPSPLALDNKRALDQEGKNQKKKSMTVDAKKLLKTSVIALKDIIQGGTITDQLLSLSRLGLKSVVVEKSSVFVSPEVRLLQSVVLKSVPLNQKPQAIGGEQVRDFPSLLAQRGGADLEQELKAKANAGLENRRIWQSIKEKSTDPKRKALHGELLQVVAGRKVAVDAPQQISESVLMEQSWIEVQSVLADERTQPAQNKSPSQTPWYWRIIGFKK